MEEKIKKTNKKTKKDTVKNVETETKQVKEVAKTNKYGIKIKSIHE